VKSRELYPEIFLEQPPQVPRGIARWAAGKVASKEVFQVTGRAASKHVWKTPGAHVSIFLHSRLAVRSRQYDFREVRLTSSAQRGLAS